MSEADYMEDGAEYYAIYGGDDCDEDCMNCIVRHECEDSPYCVKGE